MYSRAILSDCYWVPFNEVAQTTVSEFVYSPKFDPEKKIIAYRIKGGMFGFPRNIQPPASVVSFNYQHGDSVDLVFDGTLREGQRPIFKELARNFERGSRDQILEADTGSGKTVVMIKYMIWMGRSTLIVVPKSDLMDHWITHLLKFTNCIEDDIGIARQKTCDFKGKKVVVGMIHSLCKDKYPEEFKNYFGLVVFDELHKLGAPHFSKVGGMFPAAYRIGATATLDRTDGMEALFYAHLGNKVVREKKSVQPVPKVIISTYKGDSGLIPDWAEEDMQRRGILFNLLVENTHRTRKIITVARVMLESGRQTMVVSERIRHLEEIYRVLVNVLPDKKIGFYVGGMTEKKIQQAKKCDCILATTQMVSVGTDIPTARGLVFATPLAHIKQVAGRIRRLCDEVKDPVIYDLVDMFYPETRGWAMVRERRYRLDGYQVERLGR